MAPTIDWPRAKLRGRYMAAVARMERTGIPVDAPLHQRLVANWELIKRHLIAEVDRAYGVYDGSDIQAGLVWAVSSSERHPLAAPALR